MFGYVFGHLGTPLARGHEDSYYVTFLLNHYWQTAVRGDWQNILQEPMGHGINDAILTNEPYTVPAAIGFPIYLVARDPVVAYELLCMVILLLSLWAMYWCVYQLSKNYWVSVIATAIFVLHPFFTTREFDHLNLTSLFFIPLIFGLFERFLRHRKPIDALLFFLCIAGQLVTSFYYSIYLLLILPIYLVWRWKTERVSLARVWNWGAGIGLAICAGIAGIQLYAYRVLWMPGFIVYTPKEVLVEFYPWVSDYFLWGPRSVTYGPLKQALYTLWPTIVNLTAEGEHYLFWGIIPFALAIGVFWVKKTDVERRYLRVWSVLLFLSLLLSFGPDLILSKTLAVPNYLYQGIAYVFEPLRLARATGRIDAFTMFFAALIASVTLKHLLARFGGWRKAAIAIVILVGIFLEYRLVPLGFLNVPKSTREVYAALAKDSHVQVLVDLPIANDLPFASPASRERGRDGIYLYYALLHNKAILNVLGEIIPSDYFDRTRMLAANFPTPEKVALLRQWGIDAIVIHKEEFPDPAMFDNMRQRLASLGLVETLADSHIAVFPLHP
jgi:hypothetical protein